jgi:phage tail-like protein
MATTITRTDPLRNFKFTVQLVPKAGGESDTSLFGASGNGSLIVGFAAVSGLVAQNEVIPYREGGMNTHNHLMVGQSSFPPVTFSRGVFANQPQMWRWQQFMHRWNQANDVGGGANVGSNGSATDYRCDIIIKVHDHPVTVDNSYYVNDASRPNNTPAPAKLGYRLFNCWPGGYALGDLNAGESSIIVQQLTVHHEGFVVAWSDDEIKALAG